MILHTINVHSKKCCIIEALILVFISLFFLTSCVKSESIRLPRLSDYEPESIMLTRKNLKIGVVPGPYGYMYMDTIQPVLAGKGFAVVADEIRKLAESSGEQSKTISNVLKMIKMPIDKITASTDNVLTKFEAIDSGVRNVTENVRTDRQTMDEQGKGSQLILTSLERLNETTQLVKSGSVEMFEGSTQVIKESKNLEQVTQEISGGMNEMASGADEINIAVHRVSELTGKTRENIEMLL